MEEGLEQMLERAVVGMPANKPIHVHLARLEGIFYTHGDEGYCEDAIAHIRHFLEVMGDCALTPRITAIRLRHTGDS
eukprot:1417892-Rhodomonas_salina.1